MDLDLSSKMDFTHINDRDLRREVIGLCEKTGKPLLKLLSSDYVNNGLEHLLKQYGSAGFVNIRVFNDLQHTITGWPGGKPNADDTYRPERAHPFPNVCWCSRPIPMMMSSRWVAPYVDWFNRVTAYTLHTRRQAT